MVVLLIDILIEKKNFFWKPFATGWKNKFFEKKIKFFGYYVNFKFYKISDCPTSSTFTQYF